MTCAFIHLDDLSSGITAGGLARSMIVVGHRRLSIPLDLGRYTDLTVSLNPKTGGLEKSPGIPISVTDHQGNSSRPSLCLAIDTDGPIKLALHGLSGSDVVVYVRPGPVQPIRSHSTTLGRLTDHSSRAIRWVQQFAGVVLPLAEIVVLLVAVTLLIIGEIGVDLLLSQLR